MERAIELALWNDDIDSSAYQDPRVHYQATILEQYKLYVEMADHISSRRGLTNTFFLTLNTLVFTIIGSFVKDATQLPPVLLALALVIALGQCSGWFLIVRSYRQLNSAKFKVIGALETRLPASPYWRAEWKALAEGRDRRIYLPLTHAEQWIPALFAIVYTIGFVGAITA
jgi:hypothetical protein